MYKQCGFTEFVKVDSTVVQVVFRIKEAGLLPKQLGSYYWKSTNNDNSQCWFTASVAGEILDLMKSILVERVEASEKRKQKSRFRQNPPPLPKPKEKSLDILKGPNVSFAYTFKKQCSHQHFIFQKSGKSSGIGGKHRSLPVFEEKVIIYAQPRTDSVYLQTEVLKNPVLNTYNPDIPQGSSSSSYFGASGDGKLKPVEVDRQLTSLKNLVKKNKKKCAKKKLYKKETLVSHDSSESGISQGDLSKVCNKSNCSFSHEENEADARVQGKCTQVNAREKRNKSSQVQDNSQQDFTMEEKRMKRKRCSKSFSENSSNCFSNESLLTRVIKRKRMLSNQRKKEAREATEPCRRLSTPKSIELEMTRMGEILLKAAACANRDAKKVTGYVSSESDLDIDVSPPQIQGKKSEFDENKNKTKDSNTALDGNDSKIEGNTEDSCEMSPNAKSFTTRKKCLSSPTKMMEALAYVSETSSGEKEELESDCVIEEIQPVQDLDEENEMKFIIQALRNISDLEENHIAYLVASMEKYLRNIFEGKSRCRRHEDYKKGGTSRVNLTYQVPLGMYSETQYDFVMEQLVKIFCKRHFKYVDYILKVMLPEALIKIFMDFNGIDNQEEAENRMMKVIMAQDV